MKDGIYVIIPSF